MKDYKELISLALQEDIGDGDHSADSCIPENAKGKAQLLVKQDGILAGLKVAQEVFTQVDSKCKFKVLKKDGDKIKNGDLVFTVEGSSRSILKAERLALNFMQRMSGIATHTDFLKSLIKGTSSQILDTRKTTPNFRYFEKEAVRIGGGKNHRMGLYDMIMIKDNHIDYAGGIKAAIEKALAYKQKNKLSIAIEVEARNIEEVKEILSAPKVDRIMLDNFTYTDLRLAVDLIGDKVETEASGGITKDTIRQYANCGVDYISVGALTHQIESLDMSLKAV
ncbi:MAG: carboxylating nicotinate-nucleotide diphosphorylase [Vicingaceae bacterium]